MWCFRFGLEYGVWCGVECEVVCGENGMRWNNTDWNGADESCS